MYCIYIHALDSGTVLRKFRLSVGWISTPSIVKFCGRLRLYTCRCHGCKIWLQQETWQCCKQIAHRGCVLTKCCTKNFIRKCFCSCSQCECPMAAWYKCDSQLLSTVWCLSICMSVCLSVCLSHRFWHTGRRVHGAASASVPRRSQRTLRSFCPI